MKYGIVLFIILFPVFALAQTDKTAADSLTIDSLKRNVLADLMDSWTLGIDSNTDGVDIRIYNKYKSLFDSTVTVPDDVNVFYQLDASGKSGSYKINTTPVPFEVFAHDVALQVKGLTFDSVNVVDSAATLYTMAYTIKRNVYVQKTREFVIADPNVFVESKVNSRHGKIEFERKEDSKTMDSVFKKKLFDKRDSVYLFHFTQTLHINIKYDEADNSCKITSLKSNADQDKDKIICLNDPDNDAVLNQDDSLKTEPGEITANGMPDYDFDGVPDKIENESKNKTNSNGIDKCRTTYGIPANEGCPASYFSTKKQTTGFLGLQLNSAKINLPELNDLGYRDGSGRDAMDVLQSKKGALQNPGAVPGIYAGADFTYYFGGKRKRTGISAGLIYSGFTAQYKLTEPIVYTFKSSDGSNEYRRQITINSMAEEIRYNVFNLPVQFNYRTHAGKKNKTVISFKAGPSVMLFSGVTNYNATIGFGGLYQVDSITKNTLTYYDHFDRGSSWNILVTSAGINSQSTDPGADSVFSQLFTNSTNYDFNSNKNYRDRASLTRATVAFNFAIDLQREISYGLSIKAGAHLVFAPLFERSKKYVPINKTTDTYSSIYNSSAKSSYSAFGIYVGLVLSSGLIF